MCCGDRAVSGAYQVAAAHNLMENTRKTVEGRAKLGIEAFAQALLGIPKILAENSGYDAQETIIKLQVTLSSDGTEAKQADIISTSL